MAVLGAVASGIPFESDYCMCLCMCQIDGICILLFYCHVCGDSWIVALYICLCCICIYIILSISIVFRLLWCVMW